MRDHSGDTQGNRGEYRLLYAYLRDRFADRIVLTFQEIQDLVGFPLPASARTESDWWNARDAAGQCSGQSDAWTAAHRVAVVNLVGMRVEFSRDS